MDNKNENHNGVIGAFDRTTGLYVSPYEATKLKSKNMDYVCIGCGEDVFCRKGEVNEHHFAHFKNSKCDFFEKKYDTQIHNTAQKMMTDLLNSGVECCFKQRCSGGCNEYMECPSYKKTDITDDVKMEHSFRYNENDRRADIAVLDNCGNMLFIIEIYNTSRTDEWKRPDEWVEVEANNVIKIINSEEKDEDGCVWFECMRCINCEECINRIERNRIDAENRANERSRIEAENRANERNEKNRLDMERLRRIREADEALLLNKKRLEEQQRKFRQIKNDNYEKNKIQMWKDLLGEDNLEEAIITYYTDEKGDEVIACIVEV